MSFRVQILHVLKTNFKFVLCHKNEYSEVAYLTGSWSCGFLLSQIAKHII